MIRLILFDIDGTLIRTDHAGIKAFARALAMVFNVPDGTRGLNFAGRTDTGLARELFGKHRIEASRENFHLFFDSYVHWLDHMLPQGRGEVCPGVWRFISELRSLPEPPGLGLLTGNIRLGAEIKLRHFSLWDSFAAGAFGDDHEDRNQIAAIARERGSRLLGKNLSGGEILVIGDTPPDIACGRAIGAKVLAVATGNSTVAELRAHEPDWTLPDLQPLRVKELCRL
jgi:phosphoglycolate phosphatase